VGTTPFYLPEDAPDWDPRATYPPDKIKQNIGKRIQAKLYELGWRQSHLARNANIGRDAVSLYIRGRHLPGPKSLKAVADALGMKVAELAPELHRATENRTGDYGPQRMERRSDGLWEVHITEVVDQETMLKLFSVLSEYESKQNANDR